MVLPLVHFTNYGKMFPLLGGISMLTQYPFIPENIHIAKCARPRDLTGQRFTALVAKRVVGKHHSGSLLWECVCDCGNIKNAPTGRLVNGKTHSCGCYRSRAALGRTNVTWNTGTTYTNKKEGEEFSSKTGWMRAALKKYGVICMLCGWDKTSCDVHHRTPKSKGGKNTLDNAIVVCPNCHRVLHEGKQ